MNIALGNELNSFGKLVAISKVVKLNFCPHESRTSIEKLVKLGSRAKITVLVQFLGILERSYFTRYKSD